MQNLYNSTTMKKCFFFGLVLFLFQKRDCNNSPNVHSLFLIEKIKRLEKAERECNIKTLGTNP